MTKTGIAEETTQRRAYAPDRSAQAARAALKAVWWGAAGLAAPVTPTEAAVRFATTSTAWTSSSCA